METRARPERRIQTMGWVARAVGTLAAAFRLLVGLAHVLGGEPGPFGWESGVLATLMVAAAVAVAAAWWREPIGGPLVLAMGVAHSAFAVIASGHDHALAMLVTEGPFLLSGLLFLFLRRGAGLRRPVG